MRKNKVLIGCDPELFVFSLEENRYVSGHNMIPGTKEAPYEVPDGIIMVDGMALEFGVKPCSTAKQFAARIATVKASIQEIIGPTFRLDAVPSVVFDEDIIKEQPPEALELGCDPDYNAFSGVKNQTPVPPSPGFRSGGGHVHIGWGSDFDTFSPAHQEDCRVMVVALEGTLNVPSVAWDDDKKRTKLYGAPGAYRPKPYGVEYRVLSNRWLNSPKTIDYVFKAAKGTAEAVLDNLHPNFVVSSLFGGLITTPTTQLLSLSNNATQARKDLFNAFCQRYNVCG